MNLQLYLACFGVALVGMLLQIVLKLKSLQDKATAANVEFNARIYFRKDWLSTIASLLTIILFLLFIDNILKWKPAVVDFLKIFFGFVGYTGSDIASRLFSVVNKQINNVIDLKTGPNEKNGMSVLPKGSDTIKEPKIE
jgi:hypothetical protein